MANFGRIPNPCAGSNMPPGLAAGSSSRRPPFRLIRPPSLAKSDFITTRCYDAAGRQIWDADHGADVHALAVDSAGCVYQSGTTTNADLGNSLFHRVADGDYPFITKLGAHGAKRWSVKKNLPNAVQSFGICVTPAGDIYCSTNFFGGVSDGYIVKVSPTGTLGSNLSIAAFTFSGLVKFQRVRCDGDGNVVANIQGNTPTTNGGFWLKWVSDVEYYQSTWVHFGINGLGVSDAGKIGIAEQPQVSGPYHGLFVIAGPDPLGAPVGGTTDDLLAIVTGATDILGGTEPWQGVGASPNGRFITKDPKDEKVYEIAIGGTPATPVVTTRATVPDLIVQVSTTSNQALAINDSGVIAYSVDQPAAGYSHEIRDNSNALIAQPNHGGQIYDCVVLPDGKVIVAGERVARADFP